MTAPTDISPVRGSENGDIVSLATELTSDQFEKLFALELRRPVAVSDADTAD
ncbi:MULTISPECIES: hypothetical protein [Nocardia]|uniref:FXSXX-COOH protein n=1 Tax=Nocardia sputorum TaxID=2984338 RepID=A0ABM8D294_9NOCA|nr:MULTISPECIES: hypothetical protein [Nocardia]BDT95267.1 hypothetical protein IFM12275_52430 [Nocardia sputorum]BDU01475.1 hypothetical protein IFM12276_45030 [Nocardia sputorum]